MSHQFPSKPLPCKSVQSSVRHFSLVDFSFLLHFGTVPMWYRAQWFFWALWWGDWVCFMSIWFQNIVFWCHDSNNFYIALYIVEQQKQNKFNRIIKKTGVMNLCIHTTTLKHSKIHTVKTTSFWFNCFSLSQQPYSYHCKKATRQQTLMPSNQLVKLPARLQVLVYDILPSTTAVFIVTPQGPENCQLTSSFFLLVPKQ